MNAGPARQRPFGFINLPPENILSDIVENELEFATHLREHVKFQSQLVLLAILLLNTLIQIGCILMHNKLYKFTKLSACRVNFIYLKRAAAN